MNETDSPGPSVIARQALLKLASLRQPPTPDNYHKVYEEIAGKPGSRMSVSTSNTLSSFVSDFPRHTQELRDLASKFEEALQNNDWNEYRSVFMKLAGLATQSDSGLNTDDIKPPYRECSWGETIVRLLKQLESNHGKVTIARKREGLNRVLTRFSTDTYQLQKKLIALMESWDVLATDTAKEIEIVVADTGDALLPKVKTGPYDGQGQSADTQLPQSYTFVNDITIQLRELLIQVLEHVASVKLNDETLSNEAINLSRKVRIIESKQEMQQFALEFKQLLEKFEYCSEDNARLQRGLLRLLDKLLVSTSELLSEDEWIKNHIARLRETIICPLDKRLMIEVENYLDEIIQRQSIIKRNLGDARTTLKEMVTCLINNIEELSDETGDYHDKIERYSEQINQTDDLGMLNHLLLEIMKDTRQMQESTQNYRDGFLAACAEVETAQEKIVQLESELQQMSEKVHEDHLTGILNRRGLDLAFEREMSRAQRQQLPICYGVLDIDNFKVLNDIHGHKVGDEALVYLVNAVKNVTRIDDVIARYGGEEFVILLPNTGMKAAVEVLSRIKRDLTKKFFLHEHKKILITFSAGVAECKQGETQESIFKRADEALYRAKKGGKNLILEAV
ncbi:GGDEF domain-containing protein [Nitrosomonas aestuarii]|uniref:GGDEF domain-containing protein n=1 Tax=Nitrosomonas aestuarii TaxID=52441 RepID=UPI000D2F69D9|nr:GGDEF domain-containing protein [Nitrosomonas aestuarii]PTN11622.1 diguanylate cyclase [Nitrosomonas aestuarii]